MEGMGEEQKRPPDLLSQLRSSIVPTRADDPALKLLASLRDGIVSTRNEETASADTTDFALGEEIYVEEGFERETEPEPFPFESRSVELDPDAGRVQRRRAWEDYARRVADGGGEARARRKVQAARPGLRAWVELLAVLSLVIGVNVFFFPGDPGFRRLEFNPFLVPVVLLGIRFGTLIGGAAGVVCGLWMCLAGRWDLEDGSLVLPGMLVLIGMLVGILSQHQGERLAFVRDYARRLEQRHARSRRILAVKQSVIGELQSRIEEQAVSVEAMYRMSRRMSSTEPTDMFQALLQILQADLNVTRAAVYRRDNAEFALAASLDRGVVPAPFEERLDDASGLVGLAVRLQRRISVLDPEAEAIPPADRGGAVLCGPIWEGKRIEAVVVIQDLPLLELSPSGLSRVDALLGWASEVRSRLARLTEQSDPDYFDRRIGVYRFSYLLETLRREMGRAQRHGLPLRVLRVRILSFAEIPPTSVNAARECVSRALFAYLREGDTIGASPQEDSFLVILPMCEAATATAIGFRMHRAIEGVSNLLPLRLAFEFVEPQSVGRAADAAPPPLEAVA
jgi:hypothetical protein